MQFYFTAISKIELEHESGDPKSTLKAVNLRLEVSNGLDRSIYLHKGMLRKAGLKPLTQALLQGLFVNIKTGHAKGWWNEAEHMQYIIDELQRVFVSTSAGEPFEGKMEDFTGESFDDE